MARIIVYATTSARFKQSSENNPIEPALAACAPEKSPDPILTNAVVIPQKTQLPPAALALQTGNKAKTEGDGSTKGTTIIIPETNPRMIQTIFSARNR
jgi:hypothetical protein